ncbi:MAG: helix-turn-helix domain-containing protein [Pseudomonadota bacterium]
MISRWSQPAEEAPAQAQPRSFDDYELKLGDLMRGERATMGKSLLDVQRELKIKASYVAAIENADPSAFDTPGFIAGFVRSYARYLDMDPDWAFARFSEESGFTTAHGMSAAALPSRKGREERLTGRPAAEALAAPSVPFQPVRESIFSQVEPRAVGSSVVLLALVAGLAYGGYALLQEVQRVDLVPVDQAPDVVADLGAFSAGLDAGFGAAAVTETAEAPAIAAPSADALERLYRPAALDTPVLVARDAPIATLDPDAQGLFAAGPRIDALPDADRMPSVVVTDGAVPEVTLLATRPTWVRVQTPGQSVVFEKVLEPGEEYAIPVTEETPTLRAGNAGALYFRVNGTLVGPAGPGSDAIADIQLASTDLSAAYTPADPLEDSALFALLEELGSPDVLPKPASATLAAPPEAAISLVAVEDSWVRVRDEDGTVRFEGIIPPGGSEALPQDMGAARLRAGNSGALYFKVGEFYFGPAGEGASTARDVALTPDAIRTTYQAVTAGALGLE